MTLPAPTYDLMLLLDPQAEESARAKIVSDSRGAIEGQGELVRHDRWGERALTYPIDKHSSAEYHLMQFHAGSPELLSGLEHSLKITDGVLRFRIFKVDPGTPEAPNMGAARPAEGAEASTPGAAPAAPTAPATAPAAPAAASEAPAEPAAESAEAPAEPADEAAETPAEPAAAAEGAAEPAAEGDAAAPEASAAESA